jgi:hypothetical protein
MSWRGVEDDWLKAADHGVEGGVVAIPPSGTAPDPRIDRQTCWAKSPYPIQLCNVLDLGMIA